MSISVGLNSKHYHFLTLEISFIIILDIIVKCTCYREPSISLKMKLENVETKSSVFERLSEDIARHNAHAELQRTSGIDGLTSSRVKISNKTEKLSDSLQWNKSKLGQAILYGNTSQQRHLEAKLANIERQKIQCIRNMEWKQLDVFRGLAKEKLDNIKKQELSSASFLTSMERKKKRAITDQSRNNKNYLPLIPTSKSLLCVIQETGESKGVHDGKKQKGNFTHI